MSRRVWADLGVHRFGSGKVEDEPLAKEGKEMAKYWENPESTTETQEEHFQDGQLC